MFCPNCSSEVNFKEGENTAVCENCGCILTLSVRALMPEENKTSDDAGKKGEDEKIPADEASKRIEGEKKEEEPLKKQLNVFGPAAFVLGVLTIVFAFVAGLKALVLGIPGLIVGVLALLSSFLVKSMRKRLAIAGLILTAAGIILAVVIRNGFIF